MNKLEAIQKRHSVRNYLDRPIEKELVEKLKKEIEICNQEASLHLQLVTENEDAFKSMIPAFGRFKGVRNYIAMVGEKTKQTQERCGYYGAKLAILAQTLGLNTCFVTGSYKQSRCKVVLEAGESILGVIAIGYGVTQGKAHKSKNLEKLGTGESFWFKNGLMAAALAPTGMNRQNFFLEQIGEKAIAKPNDDKDITWMDLGIVKYHFEIGAGKDRTVWDDDSCRRKIVG